MAEMPPFKTWPDAVVWGVRVFQLQSVTKAGDPTTYREILCVALVGEISEDDPTIEQNK
jgi:hypothetical protein